ncbi:hypothetical protein HDU67_000754, partial [Dinochytrium kinnereticum]
MDAATRSTSLAPQQSASIISMSREGIGVLPSMNSSHPPLLPPMGDNHHMKSGSSRNVIGRARSSPLQTQDYTLDDLVSQLHARRQELVGALSALGVVPQVSTDNTDRPPPLSLHLEGGGHHHRPIAASYPPSTVDPVVGVQKRRRNVSMDPVEGSERKLEGASVGRVQFLRRGSHDHIRDRSSVQIQKEWPASLVPFLEKEDEVIEQRLTVKRNGPIPPPPPPPPPATASSSSVATRFDSVGAGMGEWEVRMRTETEGSALSSASSGVTVGGFTPESLLTPEGWEDSFSTLFGRAGEE